MSDQAYKIVVEPLSLEDGGGYIATVPELPGCMSDGLTAEEAVRNVQDAIMCWIDEAQALDRALPHSEPRRMYA